MSDEKTAYTHRTEIAGAPAGDDAETEHRDTARGDAAEDNEIRLDDASPRPSPEPATRSTKKSD